MFLCQIKSLAGSVEYSGMWEEANTEFTMWNKCARTLKSHLLAGKIPAVSEQWLVPKEYKGI
jgi:hypothetical protein